MQTQTILPQSPTSLQDALEEIDAVQQYQNIAAMYRRKFERTGDAQYQRIAEHHAAYAQAIADKYDGAWEAGR